MVELIVVIVIIGFLAVVAGPRFFNDETFKARGYYEELAAALKYSQKLAVATGCPVRIRIDAGGYAARQQAVASGSCDSADTSWSTQVRLGDGTLLSGTSPAGVSTSPPVSVTFDALGRTDLASDETITVGSFAMTLRAESGFVEAL